mmetsp:Transcript_10400/g.47735  ORF Transcript_10400/g.47735 Transcript_10400/m.47735 type:complete len:206 (-) Transcript_10400:1092-1709(-)
MNPTTRRRGRKMRRWRRRARPAGRVWGARDGAGKTCRRLKPPPPPRRSTRSDARGCGSASTPPCASVRRRSDGARTNANARRERLRNERNVKPPSSPFASRATRFSAGANTRRPSTPTPGLWSWHRTTRDVCRTGRPRGSRLAMPRLRSRTRPPRFEATRATTRLGGAARRRGSSSAICAARSGTSRRCTRACLSTRRSRRTWRT